MCDFLVLKSGRWRLALPSHKQMKGQQEEEEHGRRKLLVSPISVYFRPCSSVCLAEIT